MTWNLHGRSCGAGMRGLRRDGRYDEGQRHDPTLIGGVLPTVAQAQQLSPLMAAVMGEFERAFFRKPVSWVELLDFLVQYTLELYGEAGLNDMQVKQRLKASLPGPW